MKKIALVGYKGRMCSLIYNNLKENYEVIGIGRNDDLNSFKDLNLIIDFASHESSVLSAKYCLKYNIPIIIGATGQTIEENKMLKEISKKIKMIKKSNFAMGINVIKDFVKSVLRLNPQRFEIIERHHANKKDAPSGTSLDIKRYIEKFFKGPIEIKSIREGQEMGEHKVVVFVENEVLSVKHNVYSRDVFVDGLISEVNKLLR